MVGKEAYIDIDHQSGFTAPCTSHDTSIICADWSPAVIGAALASTKIVNRFVVRFCFMAFLR